MAPIRRYLRISKHSVLECRIFLENPADGPRWLLNTHDPALPRVFEAVKPFVLPKLREENERAKGKGKKKKSVKDVVQKDDFEVSIYLTEIATRHHLLVKQKVFEDHEPIRSNSQKMTENSGDPVFIREESDDTDDVHMSRIPSAQDEQHSNDEVRVDADDGEYTDDKKKLGLKTTYDGFSIWGWVLCLVVDRKSGGNKKNGADGGAQTLMQEWMSTQQERSDEV